MNRFKQVEYISSVDKPESMYLQIRTIKNVIWYFDGTIPQERLVQLIEFFEFYQNEDTIYEIEYVLELLTVLRSLLITII